MTGPGVWLGVDVGSVRVGVARSDPDGRLATPLTTVARDARRGTDLAALLALADEYEAVGFVVGLPMTLKGERGAAAGKATAFADRLAKRAAPRPVELADERLSTVAAARRMAEGGVRGPRTRAMIDAAAAAEILQSWLDGRRSRRPEAR